MKRSLILTYCLFFGLALTGTAILRWQGNKGFTPPKNIPADAQPDFQLIAEAWNTVQRYYVDRSALQSHTLGYGAITGMVDALGDTGHSTFLTPAMLKKEQEYTQGHYKGIGVEVRLQQGRVVIIAPIDGSPAQHAGLQPGDVIIRVDGKDTSGLSLIQVAGLIQGPDGTPVTLTILDPHTGSTRQLALIRTDIVSQNVRWQPLPGSHVAHLRIAGFSRGVAQDLQTALKEIRGRALRAIILDLRNDPGGLLDEAVGGASQFLTSGNVLLEKNQQGKVTQIPVRAGGVAPDIPMAVLINRGTASASEVMAGALQDLNRAVLVGETTFGTGTVLAQFPLSDGSALMLAVREWLTPLGHTIWHKGIVPNIVVVLPPNVLPSFPEEEKSMTAAQLQATGDDQLLRALQLLNR